MTTLTTYFPRSLERIADILQRYERDKAGEWLTLTPYQHANHAERHLILASLEESAGNREAADMHRSHACIRAIMSLEIHLRGRAS